MECVCLLGTAQLLKPGIRLDTTPLISCSRWFWAVYDRCPVSLHVLKKLNDPTAALWTCCSARGALVYMVWEPSIFTRFLLLSPLHCIPQFIQSYSWSCSVSDQTKAPKRTANPFNVFTLRTILTVHFECCKTITRSLARNSKNKLDNTQELVSRCTSWGSLVVMWRINHKGRPCHQLDSPQMDIGTAAGVVGMEDTIGEMVMKLSE